MLVILKICILAYELLIAKCLLVIKQKYYREELYFLWQNRGTDNFTV